MKKFTSEQLLKTQAYIDGQWVDASGKATYDVTNPADGSVVGSVPAMGKDETEKAIEAANKAFPAWAAKSAKERAVILKKWADLTVEHADVLAALMTIEQGKPLAEARGEILYGASFFEWFAEEGKRAYGDIIPSPIKGARILVTKQPIGVCGAITPWNFPSAMITRKVGPALAAGCTIVCKPASETPFSALALAVLGEAAGVPPGVFNIITGNEPVPISGTMCDSEIVRKISFTGSTEVGKILMRQSSKTLKKLSLELGGNAPFIVFEDADLDAAVEAAIACKYRNVGQTCVCANRLYIHDKVYDDFAARFKAKVEQMKVGFGLEEGITIGPMINEKGVEKVKEHIEDATSKGGKVVLGGQPHEKGGLFFEPTIILNTTKDMKIASEETFGPVAPLFRFKDEQEVIDLANNTEYGLAAYFFARDLGRVWRVAEALEYGMVAVNTGILSTEVAPFGGVKYSGIGREGSKYGLDEYLEMKYILMAGVN
ncbi:MAG: NAD-dependent succinate-semialdehyde dehydrogenase [Alphaproteobacteria bacterium]|nr:NAD-dependent succinate-semialdehyde dehydrogenase [Alphaproteobacteria bacterium]